MKILGIETGAAIASVALCDGETVIVQRFGQSDKRHAETILPLIETVLADAHATLNEIDVLAVDSGPGSFTGIRIGVSVANAIANAKQIPVASVDSLTALYALADAPTAPTCAIIDAANENGYMAFYDGGARKLEPSAEGIAEYCQKLPDGVCFVGDAALQCADLIKDNCKGATFAKAEQCVLTAESVCRGFLLLNNATNTPARPAYLRACQAERMYQKHMEENSGK